jgi:hypothetical protein
VEILEIKDREIEEMSLFLNQKKIIIHPKISPNGELDFTGFKGRKFVVILDQNILIQILQLVKTGELKDEISLKVVSNLLLWSSINGIFLTSGLAFTEYSHFQQSNKESSFKNNIFLKIFEEYTTKQWLDLATGKIKTIPKIQLKEEKDYSFFIEGDHYKMHFLEMLKLSQLYFSHDQTIVAKFDEFFKWIVENILICKYTTYFAIQLLGNKSKIYRKKELTFESVYSICKNNAWDLTYLSFWSTQYYFENDTNEIYLFATMDKELKELFFTTHKESNTPFLETFGNENGKAIINLMESIYVKRDKPEINQIKLDKMIIDETEKLKIIFGKYLVEKKNINENKNTLSNNALDGQTC